MDAWTLGRWTLSCSHTISHSFASLTRSISMWTLEDEFHISASLRIQPPFIRSRYYVRNAKPDVCDSPPEIRYWWRKSLLNPDRSADWLTEQFCIIISTIIQCCVVQKSNGDNLSSPSSDIFRLSVQSVCPMFNVQCRFNASSFK